MAYHSSYNGRYKPKHPEKYKGNVREIFYRSFLELKMMLSLDKDPNIEWWSSEETVVPYKSPKDGQVHRYFVDMQIKPKNEPIRLIEVKHSNQCRVPKKGRKRHSTYLEEVVEWGVNNAKWEAADAYCKQKGWKFQIITERELQVTYGRPVN